MYPLFLLCLEPEWITERINHWITEVVAGNQRIRWVRIAIVTYTITVRILPLSGVIREGINAILEAVTVGVSTTTIGSWITIIANTVAVTV